MANGTESQRGRDFMEKRGGFSFPFGLFSSLSSSSSLLLS